MSVVPIVTGDPYDCSIWLVLGDSAVLIDTGTGCHTGLVIDAVSRALEGRVLSAVILTHCHIDHVGGAAEISRMFSCPIYIGRNDAEAVRVADSERTVSGLFRLRLEPMEVIDLDAGYVFDIGGHRLRVIDSPGHTAGGICLFDEVTGALFSGDTLFENGVGRTDFEGGSFPALCRSLLELRNVNMTTLYPGHGPCCENGKASLEHALHLVGYL